GSAGEGIWPGEAMGVTGEGDKDPGVSAPGNNVARRAKGVEVSARPHSPRKQLVITAQLESELVDLSEQDALDYLRGLGVEDTGVHALIRSVYHLLGLRTFLTTGEKESRAWTIHAGDKAATAAGTIHSDFERGFIAA